MDKIEISAKTLEEALEVALRELDAEREEVAVEVISQGRTGLFGIGSEQAKVRVVRLSASDELSSQALEIVNGLLSGMGVEALSTIRSAGDEEIGPTIDIQGEDSGLLIGKRGETLQALQFLVNLTLNNKIGSHRVVIVDVEKYKERRSRSLEVLANRVAERVAASGRPVTLEPMPASERRVIHMALSEHATVTTESTGDRQDRKVTIMPRKDGY
jgi:spoIIIJ-associated protein